VENCTLTPWNPVEMRKGFDTGTYDGMVRYNVTTIVEALK
jgi:hypothetical protein